MSWWEASKQGTTACLFVAATCLFIAATFEWQPACIAAAVADRTEANVTRV